MADSHKPAPPRPVGWGGTLLSTLAAFFGVQSNRNHQRDAARGNPARFVVIGLVLVVVFIIVVKVIVRLVLWNAGMDGLPE